MKNSLPKDFVIYLSIGLSTSLYAQDNTLPSVGNVGIGTLNPQKRLQVNGKMQIDSSLVVLDSVVFQKDARIIESMQVDGETTLLGNVQIKP